MRPMRLNRSARASVAWITALLLLLCQTAFAAQLWMSGAPVRDAVAATAPCHIAADTQTSDGSPMSGPASTCAASKAVADPVKAQVLAITDLPSVRIAYQTAPPATLASAALAALPAVCHSPPLSILHCRLLN